MAESYVPIDTHNPGQVLACLGLMELTEILVGDAEGFFTEDRHGQTIFRLSGASSQPPLENSLNFLNQCSIIPFHPENQAGKWPEDSTSSPVYPSATGKVTERPICLRTPNHSILMTHWACGDGRETCKTFAGRQDSLQLVEKIMDSFKNLFENTHSDLSEPFTHDPFNQLTILETCFSFDARGGHDALRIGTSLDTQKIPVKISPLIELLAPIGLEHARPEILSHGEFRYATWHHKLPVMLARLALCAPKTFLPKNEFKFFRCHFGDDKYYKKCFFAKQED